MLAGMLSAWRQQRRRLPLLLPKKKLAQVAQAALFLGAVLALTLLVWRLAERKDAGEVSKRILRIERNQDEVRGRQLRPPEDGDEARPEVGESERREGRLVQKMIQDQEDEIKFKWHFDTSVKKDWHDYAAMKRDKSRIGLGEGGRAAALDESNADRWWSKERSLFSAHAYNAFVSEQISVNRSVKDIRHPECMSKRYSADLPTVSVVIPFINEHLQTLLRTVHSVVNRSPKELLQEVILVDDASTADDLREPLESYVESIPSLRNVVSIERLDKRGGLIIARLTGATKATGQVIIFLDSHTEANYNWLPPLLEPIAEDYRRAVCPFIDVIDMNHFEYRAQDEGKRGSFDWELYYKRLDLLPEDLAHPTRPFKSPVMAGGLFAISAQFFWELGGYDRGLQIWGGEQYELSFKIWQCGGQMFDAPCSRVGHIYRKFAPFSSGGSSNYLGKNYKRVAEVWMDEYKQYLYSRRPGYENLNEGDLTEQKALRDRLQCKPFRWFMENVAFDQPLNYPPVPPDDYAWGKITNEFHDDICVVAPNSQSKRYYVNTCSRKEDLDQHFVMDWHKDVRGKGRTNCWDVSQQGARARVDPYQCHGGKGNQLWRYRPDTKWMVHEADGRCLDMDAAKMELFVSPCDEDSRTMRWDWEHVDRTRLDAWDINKL